VCAIVVTYGPDAAFPARLRNVAPQVGMTVIVDNGSSEAERGMLQEAASDPNIDLILNGGNLGLARALNIGVQRQPRSGILGFCCSIKITRVELDMVRTLSAIHASFPIASIWRCLVPTSAMPPNERTRRQAMIRPASIGASIGKRLNG